MSEPKTVRVEVWPVAADEQRLWLISGRDAWRPALPVMADEDEQSNVELELYRRGVEMWDVPLLHSTSWHPHGTSTMLTWMAVVRQADYVRARWPEAMPISTLLVDEVGQPLLHGPTEPPQPRYVDVLLHGLRHLRWLLDTDDGVAAGFDRHWQTHLREFTPALARMYRRCPEGCPA